jgi:50S ribosomal subunit-associated GTPase HflX
VFNKIDAVSDEVSVLGLRAGYPGAVFVSALTREGIPELREAAMRHLMQNNTHEGRTARGAPTES